MRSYLNKKLVIISIHLIKKSQSDWVMNTLHLCQTHYAISKVIESWTHKFLSVHCEMNLQKYYEYLFKHREERKIRLMMAILGSEFLLIWVICRVLTFPIDADLKVSVTFFSKTLITTDSVSAEEQKKPIKC